MSMKKLLSVKKLLLYAAIWALLGAGMAYAQVQVGADEQLTSEPQACTETNADWVIGYDEPDGILFAYEVTSPGEVINDDSGMIDRGPPLIICDCASNPSDPAGCVVRRMSQCGLCKRSHCIDCCERHCRTDRCVNRCLGGQCNLNVTP